MFTKNKNFKKGKPLLEERYFCLKKFGNFKKIFHIMDEIFLLGYIWKRKSEKKKKIGDFLGEISVAKLEVNF